MELECFSLGVAHVGGYLSVVDKGVMKDGYLPGELYSFLHVSKNN